MSFRINTANVSETVEAPSLDGLLDSVLNSPTPSGDRVIFGEGGRFLAAVRFDDRGRGTVIEP
jgi:hypothetical protein